MKKMILVWLITANCLLGQNKKIESEIYRSNDSYRAYTLRLNSDATYEISYVNGEYMAKNDTLIFKMPNAFKIYPIQNEGLAEPEILKIHFETESINEFKSKIFIGTQKDKNAAIVYKRMNDYISEKDCDAKQGCVFSISKTPFLYLVYSGYPNANISKFEIPENLNEIALAFSPVFVSTSGQIFFKGYIDPTTGQLKGINDNKELDFIKENGTDNYIKPLSIESTQNWEKENGFAISLEEVTPTDSAAIAQNDFRFTHTIKKDFKAALAATKKTPNKILAVSFDLKNPNAKADFDAFVKIDEKDLTQLMQIDMEHKTEYDIFNFYLATQNDKELLEKHKIQTDKATLFFNANGDLLDYLNQSLNTEKKHEGIRERLIRANQLSIFDAVISNENTTNEALKKAFHEVSFVTKQEDTDYWDTERPVADEKTGEYPSTSKTRNDKLYALKATPELVEKKWSEVVDYVTTSPKKDSLFIETVKLELNNKGFRSLLFNDKNVRLLQASDYKIFDYFFKHCKEIINAGKSTFEMTIREAVLSALSDNLKPDNTATTSINETEIEKALEYYKKYVLLDMSDIRSNQDYMSILKEKSKNATALDESLAFYDTYFDSIIKKDKNIFESLNTLYDASEKSDWKSFKISFAVFANNTAWSIVENPSYKSYLQKAINWSEISLVIEPNNCYYLDTLANLYFLNGEKERAIAKQKEALEEAKKAKLPEDVINDCMKTLEKMKN